MVTETYYSEPYYCVIEYWLVYGITEDALDLCLSKWNKDRCLYSPETKVRNFSNSTNLTINPPIKW